MSSSTLALHNGDVWRGSYQGKAATREIIVVLPAGRIRYIERGRLHDCSVAEFEQWADKVDAALFAPTGKKKPVAPVPSTWDGVPPGEGAWRDGLHIYQIGAKQYVMRFECDATGDGTWDNGLTHYTPDALRRAGAVYVGSVTLPDSDGH